MTIDKDVRLSSTVRIFDKKLVNIFGCEIGDETFIGPFVEITRGVRVGRRCKIESHSFLCDSVTIGDDVFIGHGVMFTNDLYPTVFRHVVYKSITVCNGASIGTNATIIGGIEIGTYSIIGAGSVVTKNVPSFSIAAGNPARVIKSFSSQTELFEYMLSKQKTDKKLSK